jgi:hypothetical protein
MLGIMSDAGMRAWITPARIQNIGGGMALAVMASRLEQMMDMPAAVSAALSDVLHRHREDPVLGALRTRSATAEQVQGGSN